MDTVNPILREHIIQVIRNQVRDEDPPETKETFDRLRREGHAAQEAYRLIGYVLAVEISEMLKQERVFDRDLFVKRLKGLPELPCE